MIIDWNAFTPWSALMGGGLIGLSASMFVLLNGRIAGISGIVGGLLAKREAGDTAWRLLFIVGMVFAPIAWMLFDKMPGVQIDAGYPLLIAAGFLVGISTRYGSGCTSGHGVCGISRLSPRSLVATAAFMATGFITVFIIRHILGA